MIQARRNAKLPVAAKGLRNSWNRAREVSEAAAACGKVVNFDYRQF